MTPDELRALADALDHITPVMGLEELHHMTTLDRTADYLRACADEKPVVWVDRLTDPQPHAVTDLAYRSASDAANGVEYVPLYRHPAPAAPQAEPKREPLSDEREARLTRERDALAKAMQTCVWALRQPFDDWKGECERKALDAANAALAQIEKERSDG